jgi:molecular chaperone DnaK (HSP70)
LGVEVLGQKMSPVVEKNTKIPNTKEKIFTTVKDNQTICDINIYEGEKDKVKDNFNLGNFSIKNLPKKKLEMQR